MVISPESFMNQGDFWMKNCDLAARNEDDSENRLSIYIRSV